jgi:hypothetical protein
MIEGKDLRAAVASGLITEAQAAGLLGMAEQRRVARETVQPTEEPFVLFKGFNEIFIVIGLSILFGGWAAVTALFGASLWGQGDLTTILYAAITLGGLAMLSGYFTLTRRMIAPSIALVIMAALTAAVLGNALASVLGLGPAARPLVTALVIGAVMLMHYRRFRVPFSALIIACAGFGVVAALLAMAGILPEAGMLPIWAAGGAGAVVSVLFGLVTFAVAMWFDMSDPHRVSTRATTGFWLHVISAPAIVNTVAMHLLGREGAGQLLLLIFLLGIATVAVVIDRRSFLISGVAYAVYLAWSLFDGSALVIVFLGLGLVLLGAQWEKLRRWLMLSLPDFPGKTRLPPYGSLT